MQPLIFDRIEMRKPRYDPHPEKSTTQNSEWRKGLFIVFKDYRGRQFDWMPKWEELEKLIKGRADIEKLNKQICAKEMGI